jgi:tRNA 2-thiouridine synthesizing protein B
MVDDDALVLIEDGVYCALPGNDFNDWLDQPITVYAILADIEARGLLGRLDPRVAMIDYPQFVSLCVTHLVSKRWS